jgi:gliding motility-associated-like protein
VFNVPAGSYTVNARVVASLCGGFISTIVEEPTAVTASLVTTAASCANNDGIIDITAGGGNPGYEYSIDNGVTYQPLNQFLNLQVGNYNNIKVRDIYGCSTSLSATITLNDTMRLDLGPDSTICFGSSITLIPQTNALTDTFKWTPKATLDYDTVRTPIAKPTDTTKYYLIAKWGVCTRNDSIIINVKHKPVADAGKDTTVCYKTNATLFGSASNLSGTVNFAWSPPDSLNNPNAAVTGVRLDTTRQFTLTVTDNYGCNFSVTDSVMVFMQPPLVAFAGNDTTAIINRDHQLQATGRNAVNFVWSPIAPLSNPFIANPIAVMSHDTYFYVHITDAIGCTDDDTIFIKVYEGPTYYLPNAFSPNGDGLNDIFFPTPVGIRSTEYFRVFDRFGKLMYETRQWLQGWDGTLKGKKANSGTYVWMIKGIDKNGSVVEMKGTVILIR